MAISPWGLEDLLLRKLADVTTKWLEQLSGKGLRALVAASSARASSVPWKLRGKHFGVYYTKHDQQVKRGDSSTMFSAGVTSA